jgi:hypothetical protein
MMGRRKEVQTRAQKPAGRRRRPFLEARLKNQQLVIVL